MNRLIVRIRQALDLGADVDALCARLLAEYHHPDEVRLARVAATMLEEYAAREGI